MDEDNERHQRRKALGFAAFSAACLTVLCVAIGEGASQFAEIAAGPSTQAIASGPKSPRFNAVDFSSTGSIKSQTVVLSPCER